MSLSLAICFVGIVLASVGLTGCCAPSPVHTLQQNAPLESFRLTFTPTQTIMEVKMTT